MLFIFPFTYLVSFYLFYTAYDLDYYFQLPCFMSVLLKVWSPPTRQPVSSISMRTCQKHRFSVPIQDLLQFSSSQFSSVAQSCPTLCDPVDCNLLDFSVHGIFQARILEWVAISFSRGSSRPRDRTRVSRIGGRCFNLWATREAHLVGFKSIILFVFYSICFMQDWLHNFGGQCNVKMWGSCS